MAGTGTRALRGGVMVGSLHEHSAAISHVGCPRLGMSCHAQRGGIGGEAFRIAWPTSAKSQYTTTPWQHKKSRAVGGVCVRMCGRSDAGTGSPLTPRVGNSGGGHG